MMKITYSQGSLGLEEIVKGLALSDGLVAAVAPAIRNREVLRKAKELGLSVSDEQLQQAADSFRIARGLQSADAMKAFLAGAVLTEVDFEAFCEAQVLAVAIRDSLAAERKVQEYFVNNCSGFDLAFISVLLCGTEELANEVAMRVRDDGEDFHQLARQYSTDKATARAGGYVGAVGPSALPNEVSIKVFSAQAGEVLGPFGQGNSFELVFVEELRKAALTDEVKQAIKDRIFKEWLSPFVDGGMRIEP